MWNRQNQPIVRTGLILTPQTTSDIQSGDAGFWNNNGIVKFRFANGSDYEVPSATQSYAPVRLLSTSVPNSGVYSSSALTITAGSNSTLTLDSVLAALGDRVAIVTNASLDGIYTVTAAGASGGGGSKWVLTRAEDMNVSAEFVQGAVFAVVAGTVNANTMWELSFTAPFTMDSSTPTFTQTATSVTFGGVQTALAAASSAVGVNGQKITSVSAPSAANDAANKSYVDNHFALSAGTSSASAAGSFVFSNSNGLSFGLNGSTVTAQMPSVRYWENDLAPVNALFVQTGSGAINLSFQRVSVPFGISATQLDLLAALTVVAQTHASYTLSAAIYTFAGSSASTVSSTSFGVSINSTAYTNYSGTRYRSIPLATWNLTPGEYLIGFMASLNGPAGTTGSFSFFGQQSVSINGVEGNASNYSAYFAPGIYSAATGAFPASLHMSNINQTGSASTNNALAQPYFRMVASG